MPVLTDTRGRYIVTTIDGHTQTKRTTARIAQFVDYLFMLLYSLLLLRLILVFFHASTDAGFARFVDAVTNPFYAPFRGLLPTQEIDGGFTLAVPLLITLVVYGLLHMAIKKLLRVIAYRRTVI